MEATVDYSSICVITSITQRLMVVSFRKPTRLSLPLRKAPPFSPSLQGREDVTALRCSEPLRSKVGGPSKVFAYFADWECRVSLNHVAKIRKW